MTKLAVRSAARLADEFVLSSATRASLETGDITQANRLRRYRWFVRAKVRHGDKRGPVLGYSPTNVPLPADCSLRHGIYAIHAAVGSLLNDGVASFGHRPTFDNGAPLLEVHLFVFSGDLYGQVFDVKLLGWIRGEEHFDVIEALIAQMDRNSAKARRMLRSDRTVSIFNPMSEDLLSGA
jgi:riboflavin kinase / FMN adenylyltransferase